MKLLIRSMSFSRSTAPAVEPLSEHKQQNQTHIIKKYCTKDDTSFLHSIC